MKIVNLIILLISFFQFTLSEASPEDVDLSKAVACVPIVDKKMTTQTNKKDTSEYTKMLIKCFVSISDEQAKKILLTLQDGEDINLSEKEIDSFTDISKLAYFTQEQLDEISEKLSKAIDKFKKNKDKAKKENKPLNFVEEEGIDAAKNTFNKNYIFFYFIVVLIFVFILSMGLKNTCKKKVKEKEKGNKKDNKKKKRK